MSFAQLKKSSGDFAALSKQLAETKQTSGTKDDRYWSLKVDEAGNGYAVIRFLPAPEGEEYPFVKLYSHSFKNERTQKQYIENSLTTIGQQDPISEENGRLWNTGREEDKDQARKQKRQLKYISNIMVIKDKANPENEGKVFLYKYGPKIFDMINAAAEPQFEDEKPINPFNLWEGADFNLKAYNGANKQRTYDKSNFGAPRALFDDDALLEKVWKQEYSLQAEVAEDKFKSYDELKKRLDIVLGKATTGNDRPSASEQVASVEKEFVEPKSSPSSTRAAEPDTSDDLQQYADLLKDF